MPIADHDLEGTWEITVTRDSDGQSHKFNIGVTKAVGNTIEGKTAGGAGVRGRYRRINDTEQYVISLKLNIDGTVIFIGGQLIKPATLGSFVGDYNRLGLVSAQPTLAFDPGETGTGGGVQTT
jgi:hypothetical protein